MAELELDEGLIDVGGRREAGKKRTSREGEAAGAFGEVAPDTGRHDGLLHEASDVLV